MKQIMIRYSDNKPLAVQLEEIAGEYGKRTWTGLLFHLYSAFPKENKLVSICKEIKALFPSCTVVGTMSAGEIMEGRLIELNGRPAAEVYEKFLQIDRKVHNNAEEAFEFPLLGRQNGDDRLRSTVHIEEDGSVFLHGFVTNGMDIYLSYGNPSNIPSIQYY